jgi:aquaporin Z
MGLLMGLTATALIYSPPGQRSGAHMNPGTTLTFLVLGKVRAWDAFFYVLSQFIGGYLGVRVAAIAIGHLLRHMSINYVATLPGRRGVHVAWIAELAISLVLMFVVLTSSNHAETTRYTGVFAGLLVAVYIAFEAPISGMSMNPARTFASALSARETRGLWIYFTAPPLGMLIAAGLYTLAFGSDGVYCAKVNHEGHERCIFDCRIDDMPNRSQFTTPCESCGIKAGNRDALSAEHAR